MVKYQLRHGNDLLAMDSLRGCDVSITLVRVIVTYFFYPPPISSLYVSEMIFQPNQMLILLNGESRSSQGKIRAEYRTPTNLCCRVRRRARCSPEGGESSFWRANLAPVLRHD